MATILKAAAAVGRRIDGAVFDAAAQARGLLAAAEADAARIRASAEGERERLRADALAEGRAEGLGRAAAALACAAAERDRRLAALAPEVAALAVDVARRVLGRELAQDPAAVVDLAARALAQARERREVVLRVSPEDAALVRGAEGRLAALLARAPGLVVREDASLERGGVVVETEAGRIDARVEAQLAAMERALAEATP